MSAFRRVLMHEKASLEPLLHIKVTEYSLGYDTGEGRVFTG